MKYHVKVTYFYCFLQYFKNNIAILVQKFGGEFFSSKSVSSYFNTKKNKKRRGVYYWLTGFIMGLNLTPDVLYQ